MAERFDRFLKGGEKEEALRLWPAVESLEVGERARLAHLSATGLKRLSDSQLERVAEVFHELALEDGVISLEEACILSVVEGVLEGKKAPRKRAGKITLAQVESVLSRVAYAGADTVEEAQNAFQRDIGFTREVVLSGPAGNEGGGGRGPLGSGAARDPTG